MYNHIRLKQSANFFRVKLLKKTFLNWRARKCSISQSISILHTHVNRRQSIRIRKVFQNWLILVRLKYAADFFHAKNLLILSFQYWRSREQGRDKVCNWAGMTWDRNIKVGLFRYWGLEFSLSRCARRIRFTMLIQSFANWRHCTRSLQTLKASTAKYQELKITRQSFLYWRHRIADNSILEGQLIKEYKESLLLKSFFYWRDCWLTIKHQLSIAASLLSVKRAFTSWMYRLVRLRSQKAKSETTRTTILLKNFFEKWSFAQNHLVRREDNHYLLYLNRTQLLFFRKWQTTAFVKWEVYDHLRKLQHAVSQYLDYQKGRIFKSKS